MIGKRYLTGGINGVTGAYNDTTALAGFTTAFDRAGNKLYERQLHCEDRSSLYQPFHNDGTWAPGYDSANRLLQYQRGVLSSATVPYLVNPGASISTPTTLPGADQVRTYGLDGLGNWKTTNFTVVGSGGSTSSTAEVRQHNYVNEITSVKDTTGGTPTGYSYDKKGNLLNDGIRSYQYDALNRLVNVSNASTSTLLATYAYDALGRRIEKTVANLSGGYGGLTGDIPAGTSTYLYDGQQIALERDGAGNWTQAYFWGRYIDELLFFAVPTETVPITYRVLSDLLYRSVAIVTTNNAVTEAYDCDAYGNTLCYSGPGTDGLWFTDDDVRTNNPINSTIFTGRQYDPESQIYYYRARYYSPQIGRFISRDPLEDAESSQGPNLYWYTQCKPDILLDPFGLESLSSAASCCGSQDDACVKALVAVYNTAVTLGHLEEEILSLIQQEKNLGKSFGKDTALDVATSGGMKALATVGGATIPGADLTELGMLVTDLSFALLSESTLASLDKQRQQAVAEHTQLLSQGRGEIPAAQQALANLIECLSCNGFTLSDSNCNQYRPDFKLASTFILTDKF